MNSERARSWLLLGNAPVALFAAAATFAGLFGLAAPEPNPIRWLAIASPLLLAFWLALANAAVRSNQAAVGLSMLAVPILLLVVLITTAVVATS